MSTLEPTLIDAEQKKGVDAIMSMNRKERRKLGKRLKVKIPGSNKPLHQGNH